jgi:CRP-like cAMP-binding protein
MGILYGNPFLPKLDRMVTLETSTLFNQLPAPELQKLEEVTQELSFLPGQDIFKAGDPGNGMYVVKTGSVRIAAPLGTGERHVFARVLPGDVFGEMTLLDDHPRSAFATAEGQTEVYFVPRTAMVALLRQSPDLSIRLILEISERLREFNQQYLREVVQAERMAIVGRFASSIVHDLKNPLSVISIAAALAAMPQATAQDRTSAQERIAKQVEGITNMVNDILDFTRGGPTPRRTHHRNLWAGGLRRVCEFAHQGVRAGTCVKIGEHRAGQSSDARQTAYQPQAPGPGLPQFIYQRGRGHASRGQDRPSVQGVGGGHHDRNRGHRSGHCPRDRGSPF